MTLGRAFQWGFGVCAILFMVLLYLVAPSEKDLRFHSIIGGKAIYSSPGKHWRVIKTEVRIIEDIRVEDVIDEK